MKLFFRSINYSLIAFFLFTVKLLLNTPSYEEALVMLVLASAYILTKYLKLREIVVSENKFRTTTITEIEELKTKMSRLSIDKQTNPFLKKR